MSRSTRFILTLLCLVFIFPSALRSQGYSLILDEIKELMIDNYIFLDKAEETNALIDKLTEEHFFDAYPQPEGFATALTAQMQEVTKDKHLRVSAPRPEAEADYSQSAFVRNLRRYRQPLLQELAKYEGNIGYADLRYFGEGPDFFREIDAIMEQLSGSDAIIIDMRRNGGGSPRGVQYLCSYFIDENILLNTIYSRARDFTQELWTVDVNGTKRPDVPLFILTSDYTFSAAEDFSYTMQSLKRAQTIGEVTGGGAHPTRYFPISDGYGVSIPIARSINPITKTNWEGVGVIPNVEIDSEQALEKAKALALGAANDYKKVNYSPLYDLLDSAGDGDVSAELDESIYQQLSELTGKRLFSEDDINILGYNYLLGANPNVACSLFKANTKLYPNSVNVYDSYGEGLAMIGKKDLALKNYQKAVELATEQNDRDLEFYQRNLDAFIEKSN